MDLIRFNTISTAALRKSTDYIVSIKRKLSPYIRDENEAGGLIVIMQTNKSNQGRLFGKSRESNVNGAAGNKSSKWSHPECIVLHFSLLFIMRFGAAIRFDDNASPISVSNSKVIHRVYEALVVTEQLDIAYASEFRERKSKAIKDKLALCGKLPESEPNGVLLDIRNVLVNKLKLNKFRKEPSSGLF